MNGRFKVVYVTRETPGELPVGASSDFPVRLHVVQRVPEGWRQAVELRQFPTDDIVILGTSRKVLEELVEQMGYPSSPRYLRHTITEHSDGSPTE